MFFTSSSSLNVVFVVVFGHLFYWLTVNKLINFYDQTPLRSRLVNPLNLEARSSSNHLSILSFAFIDIPFNPRGIVLTRRTRRSSERNIKSSRLTRKKLFTAPESFFRSLNSVQLNHEMTSSRALTAPCRDKAYESCGSVLIWLRSADWSSVLSTIHEARFNLRRKFNGFTNSNKMVNNVISISGYSNL